MMLWGLERVSLCVLLATSGCVIRTIEDFSEQDSEGVEDSAGDEAMTTTATTSADSATDDPAPALSHQVDIQPLWDAHCTEGCHSPGGEWQFLDLSNAYENIVGVPSTQTSMRFIEPGNPDVSYLWHKLNGVQAQEGGGGLDMPKGRGAMPPTVLQPEELALIAEWILEGAAP